MGSEPCLQHAKQRRAPLHLHPCEKGELAARDAHDMAGEASAGRNSGAAAVAGSAGTSSSGASSAPAVQHLKHARPGRHFLHGTVDTDTFARGAPPLKPSQAAFCSSADDTLARSGPRRVLS